MWHVLDRSSVIQRNAVGFGFQIVFFLDVQIMNTPPKQCSVRDVLQSFLKWGQATGHLRKRSSDHVLVEHEDKRNYPELKQLWERSRSWQQSCWNSVRTVCIMYFKFTVWSNWYLHFTQQPKARVTHDLAVTSTTTSTITNPHRNHHRNHHHQSNT